MKIGILGGTFNPPHIGHLILAQEAVYQLNLNKVFFIPTNKSPHKEKDQLDPGQRLEMVKLAIEDNPKFQVLDIELKRRGISYTVDTLEQLNRNYPEDSFYLIIGSDLANSFDKWKQPDKIKRLSQIVVALREGVPLEIEDGFKKINITQVGVSSSQIRARIKKNKPIKYLAPKAIEKYIKRNNIYKRI
ncbi:MAG: nicotinate-nucleotide adenylyltransferase [Candidatus Omnitrophica bacterium]|nr:nicotinate-nucleotide adenylyltransferase [Candidatus Omnitrophota bacterium]MCF7893960.1 nicotinate-nucleotide adenylyltransferase [Candidatus Omnitrophota bacterium]